MDKIRIEDLRLRCIIGLNPEEREKRQDVVIQATLHADLRQAGQSDDVEHTVDYKIIKNAIVEHVEASSYQLIERLAETIAELCLTSNRVEHVDVRVDKPGALRFARSVSVEITRGRE